RKTGGWQV
ncbi:type I restriction enzyme, partial [Haemophilus influenzae]